ncbi:DUF2868 domain-containing protein [Aliikangiella sp. IMCC44632]
MKPELKPKVLPVKENNRVEPVDLKVYWFFVFVAACLGLVISWGVLSGDAQGRVNLLYLLFIYLFIPLSSLLISIVSLAFGKGLNLPRLLTKLPKLFDNQIEKLRKIKQYNVDKQWFFYQSQVAAIAFSIASLLSYFVLLVISDVNFVWRSTLIDTETMYRFLKLVASPWLFWESAQPSLELLSQTQDSRLLNTYSVSEFHAAWWQFILAVQLVYCVLARGILLAFTAALFRYRIAKDFAVQLLQKATSGATSPSENFALASLVHQVNQNLYICNWGGFNRAIVTNILGYEPQDERIFSAGPTASIAERKVAERWRGEQLVLVKSWEPPLGELADYLENSHGFICPVDLKANQLAPIKQNHLEEWQRFANKLPHWKIFIPEDLMPSSEL